MLMGWSRQLGQVANTVIEPQLWAAWWCCPSGCGSAGPRSPNPCTAPMRKRVGKEAAGWAAPVQRGGIVCDKQEGARVALLERDCIAAGNLTMVPAPYGRRARGEGATRQRLQPSGLAWGRHALRPALRMRAVTHYSER